MLIKIKCARCKRVHKEIEVKPFSKHPVKDSDGVLWTHWAICPTTTEPVLLRIVNEDDQS